MKLNRSGFSIRGHDIMAVFALVMGFVQIYRGADLSAVVFLVAGILALQQSRLADMQDEINDLKGRP